MRFVLRRRGAVTLFANLQVFLHISDTADKQRVRRRGGRERIYIYIYKGLQELKILCDLQIDTGLSKHYLLPGWCWSITCHSTILFLFPHFLQHVPLCGTCDRVDADHSPQISAVQASCQTGAEQCVGETGDVNECMPLMTERCTLLVAIYVFKLPSAVRIPNDRKMEQKRENVKSHLTCPQSSSLPFDSPCSVFFFPFSLSPQQ